MTQDSIYYFGIGEFKNFIQRIDDKTLTVAEALSTFRETENLSNRSKQMTVQQLVDQPKLILKLVSELRKVKEPESRFKLPYKKADREQELIQDLADNYEIDTAKAKAKIVSGHYKDAKAKQFPQEFNYYLEVAIAPRTDIGSENAGEIEIIGSVNSTIGVDSGETYFSGSNAYVWLDKKGKSIISSSIKEILEECGFTTSYYVNTSKKRVPSVLYINLNTHCPNWLGSAGKTHIDLRPYARDIAETVKTLAYKMPSYYGQGERPVSEGRQYPAIDYLRDFIIARYMAIYDKEKGDLSLIYRDPLTQSSVWYRLRPAMIDGQYQPKKNWGDTREFVTGEIDKTCKDLRFDEKYGYGLNFTIGEHLGIEREDLGIYAKAKGMMLYDGHVYPVNFETFEALGAKGVFILVIEKENIADVIKDEAHGSGIALVHTGGRFTKDVKKLIDKATVPIATLTDYDYDGIKIAEDRSCPRIGINKDIIDWLQQNGYPEIRIENVQEEYSPRGIIPDDPYLEKYRIELDSITAAFPDVPGRGPEALWKYIVYKIEQLQEKDGFDYSTVITKPDPDELYPEQIDELITKLHKYFENITADDWEILKDQLVAIIKLSPIKEMKKEIVDNLTEIVSDDQGLSGIITKIDELGEELDELLTKQKQKQEQKQEQKQD